MIWPYFPSTAFYFPTTSLILLSTNSNTQPDPTKNPSNTENKSQKREVQNLEINLTRADLEKAGYDNRKKPWTEEQDQILRNSYEKDKKQWIQIAELLPGRNDKMCYSRYQRLKNQTKMLWKKADNEKLCQLVKEKGENWKEINKYFQRRNPKQIKEHYLNYVRPGINKDEWTLEEDLELVKFINIHGTNWKKLEEIFVGRTQNQIKNRYFGRLKKIADKKQQNQEQNGKHKLQI